MLLLEHLDFTLIIALLSSQVLQIESQQILRLLSLLNLLIEADLHLLVLISSTNFEFFRHPQLS